MTREQLTEQLKERQREFIEKGISELREKAKQQAINDLKDKQND